MQHYTGTITIKIECFAEDEESAIKEALSNPDLIEVVDTDIEDDTYEYWRDYWEDNDYENQKEYEDYLELTGQD